MAPDFKSLSLGWKAFWGLWAVLPFGYVLTKTAPSMTSGAPVLFDAEAVLSYGLGWFTVGSAAFIYMRRGASPAAWDALWALWSALTLIFFGVQILPAMGDFMGLIDEHPEMMSDVRAIAVLVTLVGWLVLAVLAFVFFQYFFGADRRRNRPPSPGVE